MRIQLIPTDGTHTHTLDEPVTAFGRDRRCRMRLSDPTVSEFHGLFLLRESDAIVVDTGSRNGIRINGDPVQFQPVLAPGDRLQIAELSFDVCFVDQPNETCPPRIGGRGRSRSRRSLETAHTSSRGLLGTLTTWIVVTAVVIAGLSILIRLPDPSTTSASNHSSLAECNSPQCSGVSRRGVLTTNIDF